MTDKKPLNARVLFVTLGFILLALTGIRTVSSPEIFTHIALGQNGSPLSYTMDESGWIPMSPLYDRIVAALWSAGGAGLVTLVHVLVLLTAFLLLFRCFGKEWGGPVSQAFALLLCARLLFPVFNPGPYAAGMLFISLYITLFYRVKNFTVLAAAVLVLQILWTRMHMSFLFGPVLILFYAAEVHKTPGVKPCVKALNPLVLKLFGLAVAALLISLVNPNALGLHHHLLQNWNLLTGTAHFEWVSLFSSLFEFRWIGRLTVFTLILGACGLITLQKALPPMITLLALCGALLTVRSVGMLHFFAFLSFPFLILSFHSVGEHLLRTLAPLLKLRPVLLHRSASIIVLLLLAGSLGTLITNRGYVAVGSASRFGLGLQKDAFPYAAQGILERDDFPKRILNIAHDGGYIAAMHPDRRVFCDTRVSFYGDDFYRMLNQALLGRSAAWKKILSDWNPHAVVLNAGWPDSGAPTNRLIASRLWKLVYFDGATVILVRDLPEYSPLINDPAIQDYGVRILENARKEYISRSGTFFKAGNPSRLIGAGGIYLALNRPREAQTVYSTLLKGNPQMAGAWLGMGQSMILQRRLSKGVEYMEQAAKIMPHSARIWLSLLEAYRMQGETEKIHVAAEKLNRFFKPERATVEQQETAAERQESARPDQIQDSLDLPEELR